MAIIEVKPIEKVSWHGKTGKDVFSRPVTLEALVNSNTGLFAVDLTEERRKELQEQTNYDLSLNYVPKKSHEFWNSNTARVKLEAKTNVFDTTRPLDEIKVAILKASSLVANSLEEYEKGGFPSAKFVIFDEQEEIEQKAAKSAEKRKVYLSIIKLSRARKIELIQILSGESSKNQSEDWIDYKIDQILEKEGARKVNYFLERDKKRTTLHAIILEALQKNVLRKEGPSIYYMDDQLGYDLEDSIDFLADPKNQALKAIILEKIN